MRYLYKERHLVKRLIDKLTYCRRLFSRFDKLVSRCLGSHNSAGVFIWLRCTVNCT